MPAQFRNNLVNSIIHSGHEEIEGSSEISQGKIEESKRNLIVSNNNGKSKVVAEEADFNEFV